MRLALAACVTALALAGCESALDAPTADLSLQTRNALEILPPDADAAGMLDLRAVRQSALGRAGGPFTVEGMSGEGAARLDEFVRLTGFDPDEDLRRVYVAVTDEGRSAAPAFVAYGDFDRARLDAYLQDRAPAEADLERTTIAGLPVFLGTGDDGQRFGLALVNDELALMGEESALRAMIGRVESGGGLDTDAAMMRLIERAAYADGAWFAARGLDRHSGGDHMGDLTNAGGQLGEGVVSFGFESDGVAMQAIGYPRNGASVDDVADLIRGGVAAMKIEARDEPAAFEALDDVEVRTSGDAVTVRAFMPAALIDTMTRDR